MGWPSTATTVDAAPPPPPSPSVDTGTLYLELQPTPTGQLFVDDVYVGTFDQIGTALALAPGTRRIEIRERGFQPFTLAVQIDPARALVYRGTLTPEPASAAAVAPAPPRPRSAPVAAPSSKLFYYVPGCYMGDVPPEQANLAPGCDLSRTVTFRP